MGEEKKGGGVGHWQRNNQKIEGQTKLMGRTLNQQNVQKKLSNFGYRPTYIYVGEITHMLLGPGPQK